MGREFSQIAIMETWGKVIRLLVLEYCENPQNIPLGSTDKTFRAGLHCKLKQTHPFLARRDYVPGELMYVTQSLASASVGVRVGVGVRTMFKFKRCAFSLFKVLLSYLAYTTLGKDLSIAHRPIPSWALYVGSRSVFYLSFYTHV